MASLVGMPSSPRPSLPPTKTRGGQTWRQCAESAAAALLPVAHTTRCTARPITNVPLSSRSPDRNGGRTSRRHLAWGVSTRRWAVTTDIFGRHRTPIAPIDNMTVHTLFDFSRDSDISRSNRPRVVTRRLRKCDASSKELNSEHPGGEGGVERTIPRYGVE